MWATLSCHILSRKEARGKDLEEGIESETNTI